MSSKQCIVLYTHKACPGGDRAILYFRNRGIAVQVKDIVNDPQARAEFQSNGYFATPVLVIGGLKLVGFDEDEVSGILNDEHRRPMVDKIWYLSQSNLFKELPMEDLRMIDAIAPMSSMAKKTLIITPNTKNKNLYLLKQGRVRLFKVNEDGKQLTLGLLGKGNIFGETETFSTGSGSAYVEAMDDTLVCVLGKQDFEAFLMKRPEVALKMVSILTQRIRESEEMLENLAFRDVRYRLLTFSPSSPKVSDR